tara:strand:+ start:235 stop:819 length:585 start_codon:yes stop_codon:yes gene_type:complete
LTVGTTFNYIVGSTNGDRALYAEPKLKPAEIERITGVSNSLLRDWRHVGVFNDGDGGSIIGAQQPTGRWLYSMSDAVVLSTMNSLRNTGLDRVTLLNFSVQMEKGIQKALGFNVPGAGLFAIFWLDTLDVDGGFSGFLTDNPREIHSVESTTSFLFDLVLIAQNTLPDGLIEALIPVRQLYNKRAAEFDGGTNV